MVTLLLIAGGVALILFGVKFLRKGLDRLFGPRLGVWMQRLADHRLKAFFTGIGVSFVAPSSTTVSLLAVQTVQAGQMSARQMLAVMLGADIGLTVTIALISLRIEQYAPIFILVGVIMYQFTTRQRTRGIGQVVCAFGFIFLGIDTIKRVAAGIALNDDMVQLIGIAENYPVAIAVGAALLAIFMQSTTATIGLAIGMGMVGAISLPVTIAVVIGANVGIVVTTLLVGWGRIESRRMAMGNLLVKLVVAVIALMMLESVTALVDQIPAAIDRKASAMHTGFNLVVAAIGLPLVGVIHALLVRVVPESHEQSTVFGPRHISEKPPESLALALSQSMREVMHCSEIVRRMFADCWRALKNNNADLAERVGDRDDRVDLLDTEIKRYLTRVISVGSEGDESGEQMRQLRYLNELETIGDIIDKNLSELVKKKVNADAHFSDEGMAELDHFYQLVAENLLIADNAFATRDRMLAQQLLRHKERINNLERELRDKHFERLKQGADETYESSSIHLDVLTYLKRINSHVSHVAYALLQDQSQP